jgi:hypothetical protein
MRKLIIALAATAAVTVALPSKQAAAEQGCGQHCGPLTTAFAATLGLGIVGGYAAGTGYFIYRDATDATQSLEYGGVELGVNAAGVALFGMGTVASVRDGSAGGTMVFGTLTAVHLGLAAHGAWRVYDRRDDIHPDPEVARRFAILGYTANTAVWAGMMGGHHSRGYGVAEAAVNAPIAAGLGYLAYDRYQGGKTGHAGLYGGLAAVSGAFVVHGIYTAVAPRRSDKLEVLGAELSPTVVSDGREVAPGLGAAGTW